MKTRYKVILGFAVLLGGLVVTVLALTGEAPLPASCAFKLDLAKARQLADAQPGTKPREVRVERFVKFRFPEVAVRGGGPWRMVDMTVFAYSIDYADRTIVIDAAMSEAQAKEMRAEGYDTAAWQRLQRALASAAAVYVTHEHADHLGGLFAGPLPPHLHLTPEQMNSPERSKPAVISDEAKRTIEPLAYDGMAALAPGVVAIKAPGHTPGSQWFFIRREDGVELLLVGDTAWQMANVEHAQGPPKLVSLMLKNDRDANACQLAELRAAARESKLAIVPGHDGERVDALVASGALVRGFP